jgi:hypothetical protein
MHEFLCPDFFNNKQAIHHMFQEHLCVSRDLQKKRLGSVFFAGKGYESCTTTRSNATRMYSGSIFLVFSFEKHFFLTPEFHGSIFGPYRYPVGRYSGKHAELHRFFLPLERPLNCTLLFWLKRLFS